MDKPWNPSEYPFVVRSRSQSTQAGCFGWTVRNVGSPFKTYEEARAVANVSMGAGEVCRTVHQAINPDDWGKSGRWHTCFKRERGGKITEPGPATTIK